jgi:3D (Asp-Asp-Asp) domain-containing protein
VMEATAYYPGPESCGIYARNGRTYTGKKAGFGTVAVDKRVIPLGTKLYIEGYGYAEATDIGGAIKGNRIDLCFETYREAEMFGRRKVKVYILE